MQLNVKAALAGQKQPKLQLAGLRSSATFIILEGNTRHAALVLFLKLLCELASLNQLEVVGVASSGPALGSSCLLFLFPIRTRSLAQQPPVPSSTQ